MNRTILGLLAVLALATGCEFATSTSHDGPIAQCKPAGPMLAACSANAECCSYGCVGGVCAPGEQPGAVCRSTYDCGAAPGTYTPMLCKSGGCAVPVPYCRDLGDVCGSDFDCSCGNRCTGGTCAVNHAPVIDLGPSTVDGVPRNQLRALYNNSTDPDGDPLVFGWTLVSKPAGSMAALSSLTARNPTIVPDLEGAYLFGLAATDTSGLDSTGTVTLNVINTPPVVTPQAAVTNGRRNVTPVTVTAVVNDPDGDDITCSWTIRGPGDLLPRFTGGPVACFGAAGVPNDVTVPVAFPTGLLPADEGLWTVTFTATDGNSSTSADVLVTVGNDPPTPVVSRTPYYANLAAVPASTPAVLLDASMSTDPNGDQVVGAGQPGLSYFWEWVSVSDGGSLPTIVGFGTATPSFVPTRAADYILRLTVTDPPSPSRAGASSTLLVTVKVGRYIQQLAHDVIDSAYAKSTNKLVMGGSDPADATKGMIWVYDAAMGTEGAGIRLIDTTVTPNVFGVPRYLGVTPDGTKVVVVDSNVSIWFVTLGATPTVTRVVRPFTIQDLVVATNRWAYIFNVQYDFTLGAFREIDLNNDTSSIAPWSGGEGYGAASSSATTNFIYRVDQSFTSWDKHVVGNNGSSNTAIASGSGPYCGAYPSGATAIWPILGDTFVVSSCGEEYYASNLASVGKNIGMSPRHMDSTSSQAMAVSGSTLTIFDATLVQTGTDTVPPWGDNGYGRTASISKAFFNSGATKRMALVSDSASPQRYGLVVFP